MSQPHFFAVNTAIHSTEPDTFDIMADTEVLFSGITDRETVEAMLQVPVEIRRIIDKVYER